MIRSVKLADSWPKEALTIADQMRKNFHEEAKRFWPGEHYSRPDEEFAKYLFGKFTLALDLNLIETKLKNKLVYDLHFEGYIDDKEAESLIGLLYSSPTIGLTRGFWIGTAKPLMEFVVKAPPSLRLVEEHDGAVFRTSFTLHGVNLH